MKLLDYATLVIGIIFTGRGVYELTHKITSSAFVWLCVGLILIGYVIYNVAHEKRLERKYRALELNKLYYEKRTRMIWQIGDMVLRKLDDRVYTLQGYDIDNEIYYTNQFDYNEKILIPFSEELDNAYIKSLEKQLLQSKNIEVSQSEVIKELVKAINDIPFTDKVPYLNQVVKVTYDGVEKVTHITRILDENTTKFRCAKCGSKKYTADMLGEVTEEEHNKYMEVK